ncbi:AfsR/SARP family transcriptional regulator [Streptomyces massasporeus]|uniref:AfsR/SARP family transcriptional regulator n=1 Tax=Streptomyces massasporeus TaxID=67324 RepID=UPI001679B5B0|nr:AfsR/SARP family transcriptional regulator [Streptomyces massasporeus]GGV86015.1 hypothetical protein GCM10010228_66260 [Streptomyces massasporeus]
MIETAPDALDLYRFTPLVRQGRTALAEGAPARAAPLLGEARGLWRGDPLSDLPAHLVRAGWWPALDEQRLDAMKLRIDADLVLGRAADVLPELRGLIGEYPPREHFWTQRMLELFHCGRRGEALESYREVTALLAGELGVRARGRAQAGPPTAAGSRPGPDRGTGGEGGHGHGTAICPWR